MYRAVSIINHESNRGSLRAVVPYNKQALKICKFLYNEGYISAYNLIAKLHKNGVRRIYIDLFLTHYRNKPVLGKIYRVSHMGHHRYYTCGELRRKIAQDRIYYVVSTNQGWLSINDCVKRGIGGELLFSIFS